MRSALVAEHRGILDALRDGDEARLLELVDAHFDSAVMELREGLAGEAGVA